jgi:hypothetical protein
MCSDLRMNDSWLNSWIFSPNSDIIARFLKRRIVTVSMS